MEHMQKKGISKNQIKALDIGKVPPNAEDMERAVLGAIMVEQGIIDKILTIIEPKHMYKEEHKIIYQAAINVNESKSAIDILTVSEELRKMKQLDKVGGPIYIAQLSSTTASGGHLIHHAKIVKDRWTGRTLINLGYEYQSQVYDLRDVDEIIDEQIDRLSSLKLLDINNKAKQKNVVEEAIQEIKDKQSGELISYLKTGDKKFDNIMALDKGIVLIGGDKQSAKTTYVIYLINRLLNQYKDDIAILWWSMEDPPTKIARSFISAETGLSGRQQKSINYVLTEEDDKAIEKAGEKIMNYPIEYEARSSDVSFMKVRCSEFAKQHPDRRIIIVADNLGRISAKGYKGIDKDDYIAGELLKIHQDTDSLTLLVHHLTKAQLGKENINQGYRPREEYLRGSSRILDYVHQAILVNLPGKYHDLVKKEQSANPKPIEKSTEPFNKERFFNEFFILNDKGDGMTKSIKDLPNRTYSLLETVTRTRTKLNGDSIGVGYLIERYRAYVNSINSTNSSRDAKYAAPKVSIYQFLDKGMYNSDYSPEKDSTLFYLYGGNKNNHGVIEKLFIVDVIKNRESDDNEADGRIIRYYPINLNKTEFKIWNI